MFPFDARSTPAENPPARPPARPAQFLPAAERCARQLGLREPPATSGAAAAALQARREEAAAEAQRR